MRSIATALRGILPFLCTVTVLFGALEHESLVLQGPGKSTAGIQIPVGGPSGEPGNLSGSWSVVDPLHGTEEPSRWQSPLLWRPPDSDSLSVGPARLRPAADGTGPEAPPHLRLRSRSRIEEVLALLL